MREYLDSIFQKAKKPLTIDEIFHAVENKIKGKYLDGSFTDDEKRKVLKELDIGVKDYNYYETPDKKYMLLSKSPYRVGKYYAKSNGSGIVINDCSYYDRDGKYVCLEKEYAIDCKQKQEAIDGDDVLIEILDKENARVVKVIYRVLHNIVGTITREKDIFFLSPLDKKKRGITICLDEKDLTHGQIALVSLQKTSSTNFYRGKVEKLFNHKDDPQERTYLEAVKYGMSVGFSKKSLEQLKTIKLSVTEKDKVGRYDFTDWEIFSIDGADTKDKDDCISLKKLENGHFLLGVHIEDTPAYVPTNSPIHKDAIRKGNSYYFGGGVEPMLPRELSNGICSLFDGVERLTKSVLIEYDEKGNIVQKKLVKGVICSRIGMTYEKVNDIFYKGIVDPEYEEFVPTLYAMKDFAQLLRHKRECSDFGALLINNPEVDFYRDENKEPIEPKIKYQKIAEIIIEEFMIEGNKAFINIMRENHVPCIYRVEDDIDPKKLNEFFLLLDALGKPFYYGLRSGSKTKLQSLSDYITSLGPLSMVLMPQFIQCMSRAYYSVDNSYHFGLGVFCYGHNTSPIRRLSDDINSRVLDDCFFEADEEKRKKAIRYWTTILPKYAKQATNKEIVSEVIERKVFNLETCMYFDKHIGEEYTGTIFSFDGRFIHIILDNLLEGKVKVDTLEGKYTYNPKQYTMLSLDGEDDYYLGDRLRLKVLNTDSEHNIVYFKVLQKIDENYIVDNNDSNVRAKTLAKIENEKKAF